MHTNEKLEYRNKIYARYATGFQGAGRKFDPQAAARWGRAYRTYLAGWLPVRKDAAILEVACGNGAFLYWLQQLGYTGLTGVDISPEQVRLARQVASAVHEADVLQFLSESAEMYDLIAGLDFIEHLHKNELVRFLEACLQRLRPGGRLVLQTPNAESPFGSGTFGGDFTHETLFAAQGLERLLLLYGFTDVVVREAGPVVHGAASAARRLCWLLLRSCIKLWNLVETGGPGSGVYTRVFLISGCRGAK